MTKTKTAGKILKAISMSSRTCFGRPLGLPDWPFWNGLPGPRRLRFGLPVISLLAANCSDIGPSDFFHGASDALAKPERGVGLRLRARQWRRRSWGDHCAGSAIPVAGRLFRATEKTTLK